VSSVSGKPVRDLRRAQNSRVSVESFYTSSVLTRQQDVDAAAVGLLLTRRCSEAASRYRMVLTYAPGPSAPVTRSQDT
jgi:hypothetical protein